MLILFSEYLSAKLVPGFIFVVICLGGFVLCSFYLLIIEASLQNHFFGKETYVGVIFVFEGCGGWI